MLDLIIKFYSKIYQNCTTYNIDTRIHMLNVSVSITNVKENLLESSLV